MGRPKSRLSQNNAKQLTTSIKASKELVVELYHQKYSGEPHAETMMRIIHEHQAQKREISILEQKLERFRKKVEGLDESLTHLDVVGGLQRIIEKYKFELGIGVRRHERPIVQEEWIPIRNGNGNGNERF